MSEDPRIQEIREALSELDKWEHDSADRVVERIRAILDEAAPAPSADVVREFRYTKPNSPVYRAYPNGRVTRNGDEIDPSNLEHCEASVRDGAMTETAVPLRAFRTTAIFDGPSDLGQRAKERP